MPYGLIGAGAAASQGVDAAALATKLAQAQQEIELRKRRTDLEQGAALLNAGDTEGAARLLGSSSNLQDPLTRQVFGNVLQSYLTPPKDIQGAIVRQVEGDQPPTLAGVGEAMRRMPGSVTEARKTPPADGGPMASPGMTKLQMYSDILNNKKGDEAEMTARQLNQMIREGKPLSTSQKLFYIQHSRGIKDPVDAVIAGVVGGDLDIADPKVKELWDAGLDNLKAKGSAGEARLKAIEAQIQAGRDRNDILERELALKSRKTEVEIPKIKAETDEATARAAKARADAAKANEAADPNKKLEEDLHKIQQDYVREKQASLPSERPKVDQRFYVLTTQRFQAAIDAEKDPVKKEALRKRMQATTATLRPALGKEAKPSLGF